MSGRGFFFSVGQSYGFSQGGYWGTMVRHLCEALDRCGRPCRPVEEAEPSKFLAICAEAQATAPEFIASFNFVTPVGELQAGGQSLFVQELFAARAVTIFLDHPVHLADTIVRFEAAAARHTFRPRPAPPPVYGVMDEDHAAFLVDLGIEAGRIFPFPQAGPPPAAAPPAMDRRGIGLLFYGSIPDIEPEEEYLSRHGLGAPVPRAAAGAALAAALAGTEDVYLAARRSLRDQGVDATPLNTAAVARAADRRARALRRHALIDSLGDLPIHICGTVGPAFAAAHPGATLLGPLPFSRVTELIRDSRIVLNDTINLRQSVLMRLHYARAEGAVVASEWSPWQAAAFRDGENVMLLGNGADPAELLRNPQRLQAMADAGRADGAARHLWDHRLPALVRTLGTESAP